MQRIGVASGKTTYLLKDRKTWLVESRRPTIPGSVAAEAKPPFHCGDRVVEIDRQPIERYAQIDAALAEAQTGKSP